MANKYELIVVGGGLTGVAAAVCASRRGVKTLLVEASGCLGGAISQNLVYPFRRYYTFVQNGDNKEKDFLSRGFFLEFTVTNHVTVCTELFDKFEEEAS